MTTRRWIAAGALVAVVAVALALWLGGPESSPSGGGLPTPATSGEPGAGSVAAPAPPGAPGAGAGGGGAADPDTEPEESPPQLLEIPEGHNEVDERYEAVQIEGASTSYTHTAGGFRVDFPSRFNTSVPQLSGPILGRFFLAPLGDGLHGTMLYAAAAEYTPPGGEEFLAEFERLTDEELELMSEEFLSENQVAQAVKKLDHRGVPGIEIVARDVRQGVIQVTRIFFREDQMVMLSGLVPVIRFGDQEALVRTYLDSLHWL